MSNAKQENGQGPSDTPDVAPNELQLRCPSWCVSHSSSYEGTPDEARTHEGPENEAGGLSVQLSRLDFLSNSVPGEVWVRLNDTHLTVQQATALAGLLATTAAQDETHEDTVIRTIELPPGKGYVIFADLNMVGLSSRLDDEGRRRALSEAGVR